MKKLGVMLVTVLVLALFIGSGACGSEQSKPSASPILTPTPIPYKPTYSEVLKTYPEGVKLCKTEASVTSISGDLWRYEGTIVEVINGKMAFHCYGTKITLEVPASINGITYQAGTKFTVDKDMNWIEVSSWD
jgi:hypothetical protein